MLIDHLHTQLITNTPITVPIPGQLRPVHNMIGIMLHPKLSTAIGHLGIHSLHRKDCAFSLIY
jgi:hypothetical protein